MSSKYIPVVVQAIPGPNYSIYAYFSDGAITQYDVKPLVDAGGVFSALRDENFFRTRITVLNDTVAWDVSGHYAPTTCIDIDPFDVYAAKRVSDPLEN